MIDKVEKRIFDPAKIIVDPSQIMRKKPAAIRRISPDPLQPIKVPSHYVFLPIIGEMPSSPLIEAADPTNSPIVTHLLTAHGNPTAPVLTTHRASRAE